MRSDRLTEVALSRYVTSLNAESASQYECLRFFQMAFRYQDSDSEELARRAALTLIKHDPFFLITDPHGSMWRGLWKATYRHVLILGRWTIGV